MLQRLPMVKQQLLVFLNCASVHAPDILFVFRLEVACDQRHQRGGGVSGFKVDDFRNTLFGAVSTGVAAFSVPMGRSAW